MVKYKDAEEKKIEMPEKFPDEEIPPEGKISDEEIAEFTPVAAKLQEKKIQEQKEFEEEFVISRDFLLEATQRVYDIPIIIGKKSDGTPKIGIFKVKPLSQDDRSKLKSYKPVSHQIDPVEMTDEEFSDHTEQMFTTLPLVVVDPELTLEEWRKVPTSITETLLDQMQVLLWNTNDVELIEHYQNLLNELTTSGSMPNFAGN